MRERRLLLAGDRVSPVQITGEHAVGCHSPRARYAYLEAGAVISVPVLRHTSIQAACPHDQADGTAGDPRPTNGWTLMALSPNEQMPTVSMLVAWTPWVGART